MIHTGPQTKRHKTELFNEFVQLAKADGGRIQQLTGLSDEDLRQLERMLARRGGKK